MVKSRHDSMSKTKLWLKSFTAYQTRSSYLTALKNFFKLIYQVEIIDSEEVIEYADRYLSERENDLKQVEEDVTRFWIWLQEKDYAPKSQSSYLSAVKSFLLDHHIEIRETVWRKFKRRRKGKIKPRHKDVMSTSAELQRIFSHLHLAGLAFFHLQAASGTRISEPSLFTFDDLEIDNIPPRIHLKGEYTKNGEERTVFFTEEAKIYLEEYIRIRDEFLEALFQRTKHTDFRVKINSPRVFPFSVATFHRWWRIALKGAGLFERDPNSGWVTRRPHTLRMRYRTQMGAVIPVDVVETTMGHEGYETESYRKYTEEELADHYIEGCHVLVLSGSPKKIRDLARKATEAELTISALQVKILELERELTDVQKQSVFTEQELQELFVKFAEKRESEKEKAQES